MTHPVACAHCRALARLEAAHARGVRRWYHPRDGTVAELIALADTPAGRLPVVRVGEHVAVMQGMLSDWLPLEVV